MQFFNCKMRKNSAKKERLTQKMLRYTRCIAHFALAIHIFIQCKWEKISFERSRSYTFELEKSGTNVFKATQSKTVELIAIE